MRLSSHRGDRSVDLYIGFKTLAFHDTIVLAYEYIIHNFGIYEMLRQSTKLNFDSFVADISMFAKNPITRHVSCLYIVKSMELWGRRGSSTR